MTDGRAVAVAVKDRINMLGGAFMRSRETKAFGEEAFGDRARLVPWTPYMRGRCGVLGDVDADVVTAAVGFFPPELVRAAWEAGAGLPAAEAARRYAGACDAFARRRLAGLPAVDRDRLADLLEKLVADADVVAAPLSAGWRAMPAPADPLARIGRFAHVLRELRGGLHLVAVLASGLTPLEAVLTGASLFISSGADSARYFGWPEPYAEPTGGLRERRAAAESLTDDLVAPVFAGLGETDAEDLVALLGVATEVAFG